MARYLMIFFNILVVLLLTQIERISPAPRSRDHKRLTVNLGTSFFRYTSALKRLTIKLYSKSQMFLQIENSGRVSGTRDCSKPTVEMELISVGSGVKLIRGVSSARYLAMNKHGIVYSTQTEGHETLFFERILHNGLSTFASLKYYHLAIYDTLLAVSRNGTMIPGAKTDKYNDSSQFFEIPSFKCPDVNI